MGVRFNAKTEIVQNSRDPKSFTLWLKNHPIVLSQSELNILYLALKPHKNTEFESEECD